MLSYIILAILASSFLGLSGGLLLLWQEKKVKKNSSLSVSFAVGALLAAVFIDILPELIEKTSDLSSSLLIVLLGILVFYLLEKFLIVYHCHKNEECEIHNASSTLIIISDTVHNFLDGTIIAAAFLVNIHLGIITAITVFFHEIPQEIGNFAVLLHNNMKKIKIVIYNLISALFSVLGGILIWLLNEKIESLSLTLLAFASGNFLYIALTDLIPITHQDRKTQKVLGHFIVLLLGILVIYYAGSVISPGH